MNRMFNLLIELIQVSLGYRQKLSRALSDDEWESLYQEAKKQAISGICFVGVNALKKYDMAPPRKRYLKWVGHCTYIQRRNETLDRQCVNVQRIFSNDGIRSCILKGQGVARLYDNFDLNDNPNFKQLGKLRVSGDIDVWVEGNREETLRFLKSKGYKLGKIVIHHVDAHIFESTEVEVHFMPIWLFCPWHHKNLQKYFNRNANEQFSNYNQEKGFSHPTIEFNIVFLLAHIYHHFLDEGVGLRQVMDYYFLLMARRNNNVNDEPSLLPLLESCGMLKFARALMWVLGYVFNDGKWNEEDGGCERKDWMICDPDEKVGRRLLNEIIMTGNFGHQDSRFTISKNDSIYKKNFRRAKRLAQYVVDYPAELLSVPIWKLVHTMWRKKYKFI